MASTAMSNTQRQVDGVGAAVTAGFALYTLLTPPGRFNEDFWWVRGVVVIGIGTSLVLRYPKSAWGPFLIVLGLALFVRAYRQKKVREAVRARADAALDLHLESAGLR